MQAEHAKSFWNKQGTDSIGEDLIQNLTCCFFSVVADRQRKANSLCQIAV